MATLTDDELQRVRRELADNVLDIGAVPYVGHRAIYDVIRDNCSSSSVAPTASSTAVAAAGATVLTLGTTAGLAVGDKVQLDADDARETVSVRAITGTTGGTISVVCRKPHAGTYPVEQESALTLVRGTLADLAVIQDEINAARAAAGLKRADEVEWFGAAGERTALEELRRAQHALRRDLARLVGLGALLDINARRGDGVEVY